MKKIFGILILLFMPIAAFDVGAKATFTRDQNYLYIKSDGLPNHKTGQFPGAGNPNKIAAQDFNFKVTLHPQKNSVATPINHDLFGVAINGVVFDPATAEFWNDDPSSGWNKEGIINGYKTLGIDASNAHVQPNGTYHYHSVPLGIVIKSGGPQLVGYAADGFGIYVNDKLKSSYQLKQGSRGENAPSGNYDGTYSHDYEYVKNSGNLDECNGYFGKTKEYPNGSYYYVITEKFPMVPRCWMGNADSSFMKRPNGKDEQENNKGRPAPPQVAIDSCQEKSSGQKCNFTGRRGKEVFGICRNIGEDLACVPKDMEQK